MKICKYGGGSAREIEVEPGARQESQEEEEEYKDEEDEAADDEDNRLYVGGCQQALPLIGKSGPKASLTFFG